jgi:hypothetical protein
MQTILFHIVLYTAGFLMLASCDLFEPRSPEEPTGARGNFIPPTTPEIVIENFINALNERNAQHYVQCFAEPSISEREFVFEPTTAARNQFSPLFEEWTVRDERMYIENLISSVPANAAFSLNLQNGRFESQSADEATYTATYRLIAQHSNEGYPHYVFDGTLRFEMATDQTNSWVIFRWRDLGESDQRSWSELKGIFKL